MLKEKEIEVSDEILKLVEERNVAKSSKDYNKADEIRDKLLSMGIVLKDTKEGTVIEKR